MIIGLTGYARSGKDSAAGFLVDTHGYTKLGFADGVRDLAAAIDPYVQVDGDRHYTEGNTPFARYSTVLKTLGYEAAKSHPDVRRLLQRIGTEGVRSVLGDSVWLGLAASKLVALGALGPTDSGGPNVVLSDVRFANEADFIHAYGGVVVRLVRPGYGGGDAHASETGVDSLDADFTIVASTLTELVEAVDTLVAERIPALRATRMPDDPPVISATRVYLAAPWAHRDEAIAVKARLVNAGLNVVSGWTERESTAPSSGEIEPARMQVQAQLDWDEVVSCDVLVVLGLAKSDGKATEMGIALTLGKRVILVKSDCVGNIFYHLPEVERVDNVEEVIWRLGGLPDGTSLLAVRRGGDNVVEAETGKVIATKLGTISDIATSMETAAQAVDTLLDEPNASSSTPKFVVEL